jgi:hypothetical protein
MAATTTAGTDNHEEIRPLRDKFEDRETQIVHELYTQHFPKGMRHPAEHTPIETTNTSLDAQSFT